MKFPRLGLLRAYYLFRRGAGGSINPGVRRMRTARDAFYRRTWERAAGTAGARFTLLSDTVAEIAVGRRRLRVASNMTSLDDPVTWQLAGDKPAVYRLLVAAGLPVPRHMVLAATEAGELGSVLQTLPPPLIVKPAADTGAGSGVSTNIETLGQLHHAFAWASAYGRRILIETQIDGDCYRVLLLDGKILDTVLRRPPCIIGNGRSTVRRLIAVENTLRLERGIERAQVLIGRDPDLIGTLAGQGLSLRSRPAAGRVIKLKRVINDNRAEENEQADDMLCPAIIDAARRAVKAVGLRLAGVDIICRDPGAPLQRSGGAVIEVNATPGLYYHYHRRGAPSDVADQIIRCFLAANVHAD